MMYRDAYFVQREFHVKNWSCWPRAQVKAWLFAELLVHDRVQPNPVMKADYEGVLSKSSGAGKETSVEGSKAKVSDYFKK